MDPLNQALSHDSAVNLLALFRANHCLPLRLGWNLSHARLQDYLHQLGCLVSADELDWARAEIESAHRRNIRPISFFDPEYPQRLTTIDDPPIIIFVEGRLPPPAPSAVAIVGTRNATRSGSALAADYARLIAASGGVVVSGLARGIDAAAHRGALEGSRQQGYPGVAVIGSGFNYITPAENIRLKEQIIDAGGAIISEYGMSHPPGKRTFPQRNRIVSGLSDGVIVIEAKQRSGALITARLAVEQGREVFVVPGSPNSPVSLGSNRLLRDGATPLVELEDVKYCFEQLEYARPRPHSLASPADPAAAPGTPAGKLMQILHEQHLLSFDELVLASGLPAAALLSELSLLELDELVYCHPGSLYSLQPYLEE